MPLSCTDWRLPTRAELQDIRTEIALDQFADPAFPQAGDFVKAEYWTGENEEGYSSYFWSVHMNSGTEYSRGDYTYQLYARGVREDTMEVGEYDIGDEGPGDGIVFYIDGTDLIEVTNIEMQAAGGAWQHYHPQAKSLVEAYVTYKYASPPVSIVATSLPNSIKVDWGEVSGAVNYKCFIHSGDNEDPETADQVGGSINTNTYTITDLTAGVNYNIWLKTTNQRGDSVFSEMVSAEPLFGEGDLTKAKYDAAFLKIGNTITIRKYPISAGWTGTFPHRDSTTNNYLYANMETEDVKGIVSVTSASVGATRSTWTSDSGQSYPTSVKDGVQSRALYLPVNSTTNDILTMDLVASTTANRDFNYGRDVIVFLHNNKWFWAGTVEKYSIDDVDVYYKLTGQVVDEINWPFEYCFDIRGNVRIVEKTVSALTDWSDIIDLDS